MADDIPPDVTPPTVTQTWGMFGPPMDGDTHSTPGPRFGHDVPTRPSPIGPPDVRNYVVSPGSIEEANSQMLSRTGHLIDSYTSLKDYITATKSWIFSVPDPKYLQQWDGQLGVGAMIGDPNPKVTQEMSAVSDNLLLQVADVLETTGQFIRAMNNAGQFYTRADKDSDQPTLPVHSGNQPPPNPQDITWTKP